jgi:glycosyltransferase involved in cell wall biosynthesis
VPDRGPLDRSVLREMLAICKHYNVRIWHGHDYKSNLIGLMLRPFWSMKYVTTVHGWVKHTSRTPLYYAVDRWSLPFYHHVICVSQDLADRLRGLGVGDDRLSLIQNAIDERAFDRRAAPADAAMRRELGTPPGRLVVGAAGRLSAEKAFNNLIHAAQTLIGEGIDIELWIAGDGDQRPALEKLIAHRKLAGRVRLLGFHADMKAFYESLDLFALSSLREGLPNVLLEAMAMRVPVVSTEVAGVPRLVRDGETGLLCPIGDVDALAGAMRRALSDATLRSRLADAGRSLIEREYSFARRMLKVRAVYDKVLGLEEPQRQRAGEPESQRAGDVGV